MKNIAFIKFLDKKDKPSGKTYPYLIDDPVKNKLLSVNISNKANIYHITNESGYDYRKAKVVCVATAGISNEEEYNLSGLKRITSAECCGEIEYSRSERNQDEYEARRDFDRARKITTTTVKNGSDIFSWLDGPYNFTSNATNKTTQNDILNTWNTCTTGKLANVGTTTIKLNGTGINTNTNTNGMGIITNTIGTGIITNTPKEETNYLKLNNLPKINTEEKKEKTMFESMMKNLHFGKANDAKMSIYGPALREAVSGDTWIAFDKSKEQWIDVPWEAILDIPLLEMPVAKSSIQIGDFIFHAGTGWVRVIDFDDEMNYFIEAEDPSNHEIIKILPTRNMFGFDFYTKLIVPFDMGATFGGASASNPFGMLPMLMMMSDKNKSGSGDNSMLMAMMMMQNGGMDFASNPMMLYALMGDKGGDNSMLMAMLMSQMMQGASTKHTCNCDHN